MAGASEAATQARAFSFIRLNEREHKLRTQGITETCGPYYTPLGRHMLEDIFETVGEYIDPRKFAGGLFTLMPRRRLVEIIDRCHQSDVLVSTGFIERVLAQGPDVVDSYVGECRDCGFDIIEISSGFISLPADDWLCLVDRVQKAGVKGEAVGGIQCGAGGATRAAALEKGTRDDRTFQVGVHAADAQRAQTSASVIRH
jgi:phosphosulfolactate synthase (CoM biosynthesis protein A)